jgi:hypothetical protein
MSRIQGVPTNFDLTGIGAFNVETDGERGYNHLNRQGDMFRAQADPDIQTGGGSNVSPHQVTASQFEDIRGVSNTPEFMQYTPMENALPAQQGPGFFGRMYNTIDKGLGGILPGGQDFNEGYLKKGYDAIGGYEGIDKTVGGVLPGGQPVGEGYMSKGYNAIDQTMGGYLPGGVERGGAPVQTQLQAAPSQQHPYSQSGWGSDKTDAQIREMQRRIGTKVDGMWGPKSEASLSAFQNNERMAQRSDLADRDNPMTRRGFRVSGGDALPTMM